jgi:zinc-ribbon domain
VLCPKCRNDNPADYRFCGMCGTPLDKPALASEPASTRTVELSGLRERTSDTQPPGSGPSLLGLNEAPSRSGYGDSSRDVTYLFEDERPRRTYWRFTLVLIILLGFAGLGWLEYTRSGKSWTAPWSKGPAQNPVQASQQAPGDQNQAAPSQPPADNSAAPKPEDAPAAAAPTPSPAPAQPAPPENQSGMKEAATGNQNQMEAQGTTARKHEQAESASAEKAPSESDSSEEADTAEPAKPTQPAKPEKVAKSKPKPAPATSPDDALVTNAEKYLYGRGVPQNCDRALSSLRAAADRENLRARSLLGTMYATGHCVPRDLPNAYRWFALASRENTDNMWVQRNLEMIWREMTPQERQLATQRSQ